MALSYGSRQEITAAARKLAADVAAGELDLENVDENALETRLFTVGIPDPDLIIRSQPSPFGKWIESVFNSVPDGAHTAATWWASRDRESIIEQSFRRISLSEALALL